MTIAPISRSLIALDKTADVLPIVSTITNLAVLILKSVIPTTTTNHYFTHIKDKSTFRCFVLLFPVIGNLCVVLYDCLKKSPAVVAPVPQIPQSIKRPSLSILVSPLDHPMSSSPILPFSPLPPVNVSSAPVPNSAKLSAASAVAAASESPIVFDVQPSLEEEYGDFDSVNLNHCPPNSLQASEAESDEDSDFFSPDLQEASEPPSSIDEVSLLLRYKEAIEANPLSVYALLQAAPLSFRKNKVLCLAAIQGNLDALKHFALEGAEILEMLENSPNLNLGTTTRDGLRTYFINPAFLNNKLFVQTAMQHGSTQAYAFASEEVRGDEETALQAIQLDGRLTKYVPDKLKANPKIEQAAALTKEGYQYLLPDSKKNVDLLLLSMDANVYGLSSADSSLLTDPRVKAKAESNRSFKMVLNRRLQSLEKIQS